ncbi:MAG: hypothetical protein AAGG51_23410 [Cyanobacteria bacterium P01_G01_bin.54]
MSYNPSSQESYSFLHRCSIIRFVLQGAALVLEEGNIVSNPNHAKQISDISKYLDKLSENEALIRHIASSEQEFIRIIDEITRDFRKPTYQDMEVICKRLKLRKRKKN